MNAPFHPDDIEGSRISESQTRKKTERVTITPKAKETLRRKAEQWGYKMGDLTEILIEIFDEIGVKPGLFREHMERKAKELKADKTETNAYAFLDDAKCQGLQFVKIKEDEGWFMCIWARPNSPPVVKKIAQTPEGMKNYCLGCNKTMEIVEGYTVRDTRIAELENQIQADATAVFKAPVCKGGASLSRDGKRFEGCRKTGPNEPAGVEKFCKIYDHGTPCALYTEAIIGVGTDV